MFFYTCPSFCSRGGESLPLGGLLTGGGWADPPEPKKQGVRILLACLLVFKRTRFAGLGGIYWKDKMILTLQVNSKIKSFTDKFGILNIIFCIKMTFISMFDIQSSDILIFVLIFWKSGVIMYVHHSDLSNTYGFG